MKYKKIILKNKYGNKIIKSSKYENILKLLQIEKDNISFQDADLRGADLQGAYLQDADLRGADKYYILPDIYLLKLQNPKTKIKMWKWLIENNINPYQNFKYEIKKEYNFNNYDDNKNNECGAGGNIATLQWCLKDSNNADIFMEVEFNIEDIIAIPYVTDGKMRVKRFRTLRIINREKAIKLLNNKMNIKE